MKRHLLICSVSLLIAAAPGLASPPGVVAQTAEASPVPSLASDAAPAADSAEAFYARVFTSADGDGDGRVSIREATRFQHAFFAAMDANDDKELTRSEFTFVDFGESQEAARRGRGAEVRAVLNAYFDEIDKSGDGVLSSDEHILIFLNDFRRTDIDGDGGLSQDEFTRSMPVFGRLNDALDR